MSDDDLSAASITTSVITAQLNEIRSALSGSIKNAWQSNFKNFGSYLDEANRRYGSTKTLLYKDKRVPLGSLYVGTRLSQPTSPDRELDESDVIDKIVNGDKVLITATAGAGKSFFARYLFLSLLSTSKSLPILIELRNLNDNERTILEQFRFELTSFGIDVAESVVEGWLRSGKFTLILDGYDELSQERIHHVNAELTDLAKKLANSSMIVTSRPSEQLEYFSDFDVLNVLELSQEQAIQLITKLHYDYKVKKLFLEQLKTDLFQRHSDFLSNPLLLTIMLMTYGDIAEIPSKMHVFYEHAFDVLFYKHDASKGVYSREMKCALPIDDFKRVLGAVCASGYIRSKASYTNTELLDYIRKAKETTGINKLNPENFKMDLLQSVCILVPDGNYFTFNHRTFQEYFAALFAINVPVKNKKELYKKYLKRGSWDNALNLAFEINQAAVESEFILPFLEESKHTLNCSPVDLLQYWLGGLSISWFGSGRNGRAHYGTIAPSQLFDFLTFLERAYSSIANGKIQNLQSFEKKSATRKLLKDGEFTFEINFNEYTGDELNQLKSTGLLEHVRSRQQFMVWLYDHLNAKENSREGNTIETWL